MTLTAVVIDSREPEWVQRLKFGDAPTLVTQLDAGDLLATTEDGDMLLVERKTADDLLNTIRADRFLPQMSRMAQETRWAYLVITGYLAPNQHGKVITERGETGWSWAAIQGALLLAQELGVFVVYAANDADYEAAVLRLAARRRDVQLVVAPPKLARELNTGEQIVASLPGIGTERLGALMEYCGSAAWALDFLTDPHSPNGAVPGIGAVTKAHIRQALGLADNEALGVVAVEQPATMPVQIRRGQHVQAGK